MKPDFPFFESMFVQLNTSTGVLRFFKSPTGKCQEEFVLRQAVVLADLNKFSSDFMKDKIKASHAFAVHNGDVCFLFAVPDQVQFDRWTRAFQKLEVPEYKHLPLWVDKENENCDLPLVQSLSPVETVSSPPVSTTLPSLTGYLCKTQQYNRKLSKDQVFY